MKSYQKAQLRSLKPRTFAAYPETLEGLTIQGDYTQGWYDAIKAVISAFENEDL